jgi:hypothetical protein
MSHPGLPHGRLLLQAVPAEGFLKEPIYFVCRHLVDTSFNTFIWRKHLMVCLFLWLLAIPIYFVDQTSMGGGGAIGSHSIFGG